MFNYAQAKAVIIISVADEVALFIMLARFDVIDHGGMGTERRRGSIDAR